MGVLRLNGKAYGGGIDVIEVTQAQYNALPESKLSDDILYVISDSVNGSDGYPPLIYSTEEREVGVWCNGKPIYQKSFYSLSTQITNPNTWYDTGLSADGIESFVGGKMMDKNNYQFFPVSVAFGSNHTKILVSCPMGNREIEYLTIQYTKITDTKGSGRWTTQGTLAQHYSTTERLIGTWIDGKPLYQKTIEVNNPTHGAWTQIISDNNINIIGYINEASYAITQAGEKSSIDFCVNSNLYGRSLIYNNEHSMQIEYYNPYGTLSKYIVTIQYTKTTD